jgi:hypothetical protein
MKPYILIILMVLALALTASAQYIPINHIYEMSDTATAAWDSTWLGPTSVNKYLHVINDDTANLYFCIGADTASGKFITIKPNEYFAYPYIHSALYVRTKADSTCIRRIRWGYR